MTQNYTNPFNLSNKIEFEIPDKRNVSFRILNMLGQEIIILANGTQDTGIYHITFEPEKYHLSSGVYLYQLQAGSKTFTIKMIYLR